MTWRVLGIDPGLSQTGWGIVDASGTRITHIAHGTIRTTPDTKPELRLLILHRELEKLITEYGPRTMGIETLFFTKNISSAIPVAQARGVTMLAAAEASIEVGEYSPLNIKQSVTGEGGAEKSQVQEMIRLILGLSEIPRPDHAADALAAAVCHVNHRSVWSTASAVS